MLAPGPVVVTGAGGQLGRALAAAAWPRGFRPLLLPRAALDIADDAAVRALLERSGAVALINAAAWTAVDAAEGDAAAAWRANAEGPAVLAAACAGRGIPLLHLSTDFVFAGDGGAPYREADPTGPLGVYGASKLAGEEAIRRAGGEHLILRTAWVFSAAGRNFLTTMLRLAAERAELRVVADQRGCPTAAADVAAALTAILAMRAEGRGAGRRAAGGRDAWGTFHFAGAGETSWHGFAATIVAGAAERGLLPAGRLPRVTAIATSDWPTAARRPADSRLDCGRLARCYGIRPRPWRTMLAETLAAMPRVPAAG